VVVSNDDVEYIMSAETDEERGERLVEVLQNYERKAAAEAKREQSTGGQADLVQEIISTLMQMGIEPSPEEVAQIEALPENEKRRMLDELRAGPAVESDDDESDDDESDDDEAEDYAEDEISSASAFGIPSNGMDAMDVGQSGAASRPRTFGMRIKPRRR